MKAQASKLIQMIFWTLLVLSVFSQECQLEDDQFFVTFHPHLDAFWLNTDDELKNENFRPAGFLYNMNQRNSKQIFNSMLEALQQNETRKYFVSEIVFFKDWYDYLSSEKKEIIKNMLKNGQIDIANSGWVENDQAVCYYDDILDQYTVGMNWMYEEFGYVNKIGWATDSFGHSHSQVALQHLLGFEFQGIERVDDRYVYQRKDHPLLEFYWQPVSDSNNLKYGGLLNQVRHFLHQVNDLRRTNDRTIANDFNQIEKNMKKLYGKNKLFRFLGNDFEEFVPTEFQNLESAMTLMNKNGRKCPKFKYGNPQDYLTAVKPYWSQNKLEIRQHDFMPNWDQDRYWTGYYTTDPELKYICKYFSRLLNLARKEAVLAQFVKPVTYESVGKILLNAQQLNAVMQHHDGITATSKAHIENLFKERMKNSSKQLVKALETLSGLSAVQTCQLFKEGNSCKLSHKQSTLHLVILHRGALKKETLELQLPQNYIYIAQNHDYFIVQSSPSSSQKTLVFQAEIKPGKNVFVLQGQQSSNYKGQIGQFQTKDNSLFQEEGLKVQVDNNVIKYGFGENYLHFSYQWSANSPSRRKTVAWNKYGARNDKTQSVNPGIYIMSNTGKLENINLAFTKLRVLKIGNRRDFIVEGQKVSVRLSTEKENPAQVTYKFNFTPSDRSYKDYFLRIESNIKSPNDEFFHDANGYLVSRRKIGSKPDYEWEYKPEDKINANTYPACSFFYLHNDKHQKLVAFLDRAQGISTYDGSMLINVDRLAQDDYKGVGEAYTFVKQNTFHFKFAITSSDDDLERIWQRQYDEALLGFVTGEEAQLEPQNLRKTPEIGHSYLKYTLAFLNKNEILLRLQNMAERSQLKVPIYKPTNWFIPELSLNLTFSDIRESFANGILFKERYNWVGDEEEINSYSRAKEDTKQEILLKPLEIRSFRINLKGKIEDKQVGAMQSIPLATEKIRQIDMRDSVPVVKHFLRKRCF